MRTEVGLLIMLLLVSLIAFETAIKSNDHKRNKETAELMR